MLEGGHGGRTDAHHVDKDVKAAERARQLLVALHEHPDGAADAAVHELSGHDRAGVAAIVDLRKKHTGNCSRLTAASAMWPTRMQSRLAEVRRGRLTVVACAQHWCKEYDGRWHI